MNAWKWSFLLAPALVWLTPTAQTASAQGLTRLQPIREAPDDGPFSADAWRAKLSDTDLDRREQDFERLAARIARDADARKAVEQWAREGDGELAWTARLLLREAERVGDRPLAALHGAEGMFGLWLDDMDDVLGGARGVEPGRFHFFHRPQGGAHGGSPGQSASQSKSEQFSLQIGPDGVTCKVTEDVDGERKERTYSAESLEALLEAHPELRGRIESGGNVARLGSGLSGRLFQIDPDFFEQHGLRNRLDPFASEPPRTDRLGVVVRPLPEDERRAMGLDANVGLFVERVESGSIADALGIQRGQVLVELNGRSLATSADITDQICNRAPDVEVRVELVDRWGQRRTRTWKPEAGEVGAPRDGARKPPSKPTIDLEDIDPGETREI